MATGPTRSSVSESGPGAFWVGSLLLSVGSDCSDGEVEMQGKENTRCELFALSLPWCLEGAKYRRKS